MEPFVEAVRDRMQRACPTRNATGEFKLTGVALADAVANILVDIGSAQD